MKYYVYLIRCADNSLYCGMATNIQKRVEQHNAGKGSKYVRSRGPAVLVYTEEHGDISSALKREADIKKWSKLKKEELVGV